MLLKRVSTAILLFLLLQVLLSEVNCYSGSATLKKRRKSKNRQKRQFGLTGLVFDPALNFYFEYNSCYALAAVVSLPLELPASRSVFLSYNFETNYYFSYFDNANGLTPLPFSYITDPNTNQGIPGRNITRPNAYRPTPFPKTFGDGPQLIDDSNDTTEESFTEKSSNNTLDSDSKTFIPDSTGAKKSKKKQAKTKDEKEKLKIRKIRGLLQNYFMSRRRFFKMMESKMDRSGLNGNSCLLNAICETAADSFGQHNGVIGSVVDVLFLPSASKDEKLPKKYYKAEADGKSKNCITYNNLCPKGLFEFITTMI